MRDSHRKQKQTPRRPDPRLALLATGFGFILVLAGLGLFSLAGGFFTMLGWSAILLGSSASGFGLTLLARHWSGPGQ